MSRRTGNHRLFFKRHGHSRTPTYRAWVMARSRCYDPYCQQYKNYGGRGITMAPEWNDFMAFLRDMGLRPDGCSLDRIDNDGNYEPGNCRWATLSEQSANRRTNRALTHLGRTQTVTEWARELGLSVQMIFKRLEYGWSDERTLTQPARRW